MDAYAGMPQAAAQASRGYIEIDLSDRALARPTTASGVSFAQQQQLRHVTQLPRLSLEKSSLQSMDERQPNFTNHQFNTTPSLHFTGINDLTFLQDAGTGFAQMTVVDTLGSERTIGRLNLDKIKQRCPVLAHAFEEHVIPGGFQTHPVTSWCDMTGEAQSAVIAVLRWIYMDDYTFCEAMIDTQVPLLLHLQVLYLAQKFEANELEISAQMKIEGEAADAAKMGEPIADLCEAVRYLYTYLRECEGLRRLIASYIMSNLEAHLMNEQEAFRQTVYQSPLFHRDLIRANFENNFNSPMADAVIKMPVCRNEAHGTTEFSTSSNDFFCEFHTELGLLYQAPQVADCDIGANNGQIKPASLRRKFSFDKNLEHSKSVTSAKRPRQQVDQIQPEERTEWYPSQQQRNLWPAGTIVWPPERSDLSRRIRPLEKVMERSASDLSKQYKGFEMNAERYKRWEASIAFRDQKAERMPERMPEGQFVDAFEWPDPTEVEADPKSETSNDTLLLYNEPPKRELIARNPDVEAPSVKLRPSAESYKSGFQLTDTPAAGTPRSSSVRSSDRSYASSLERYTFPGECKPAPKTSIMSEMRRNTRLSGLGEAFENTSVSKDTSASKQTEAGKSTLATLLNGCNAYSRGPDDGENIKPDESQPDWDFVKIEQSQASSPVREEGFEVMDISSDDDWENVNVSEGNVEKGKGKADT